MSPRQSSFISLAIVAVSLTAASCIHHEQPAFQSRWPLVGSTTVPAASGEVTISRSANGNTRLAIRVHHLAPPWRIAPGAGTYVAWVVPLEGAAPSNPPGPQAPSAAAPVNIGAIKLDSNLDGNLDTVTPLRQFQLLITPEPGASAQRPTNRPVLTATLR